MALTAKQEAFCQEYLIDLNATQAATRAGYSAKTANEQGARLLANVSVQAAIQEAMTKRAEAVGLAASDVLRDIDLVKADAMAKIADKEGNMVMANHAAALKALELQGKHLKMFTDKLEVDQTTKMDVTGNLDLTLTPSERYKQMMGNGG